MRMDTVRGQNNRRKTIVLVKVAVLCNDDGNEDDEVKGGDADLKSPELVLVILVLALHVAIPDHQECQHLDRDLDEDLSPASVVNTLPPSSAVSR